MNELFLVVWFAVTRQPHDTSDQLSGSFPLRRNMFLVVIQGRSLMGDKHWSEVSVVVLIFSLYCFVSLPVTKLCTVMITIAIYRCILCIACEEVLKGQFIQIIKKKHILKLVVSINVDTLDVCVLLS